VRSYSALLAALVLSLAGSVAADEGRREINQACALVGCFAGDSAGFPVVLTTPGSYVLTGNLSVADPSQHGISTQSAVDGVFTIDLNGFEIAGPVTCAGQGSTLACGAGAGVGVAGSSAQIVVKSGRVTGFGSGGIAAGAHSRIDGVIADANGGPGIATGAHSLVHHSIARRNEGIGIQVDAASIVEGSAAAENLSSGIAASGVGTLGEAVVVKECTAYRNGGGGVGASSGALIEASNAHLNGVGGLSAGPGSTVIDNAVYANTGEGIYGGTGSAVSRNTVRSNSGLGISVPAPSTYRENTITGNAGGAVSSSGVDMLANFSCLPSPCWVVGDLITYRQSDWGSDSPNPARQLLIDSYADVYPSGLLEVGISGPAPGEYALIFLGASPASLLNYLPAFSGTPGALLGDVVNPTGFTPAGPFGGEVTALRLNVDFSDAGLLGGTAPVSFGDLRICAYSEVPQINGQTVGEFLATASTLLGGGAAGLTVLEAYGLAFDINEAFFVGPHPFAQEHLVNGPCP
jgi:hypothetical protein